MFGLSLYTIYIKSLIGFGMIATAFWAIFEVWVIASFFWAYIDEKKWQLPKPLEFVFCKFWSIMLEEYSGDNGSDKDLPGYKNLIESINSSNWCGNDWKDDLPPGGRVCLVSFGFIGRVLLSWVIAALWPIILAAVSFWATLRSLRFIRRTQKTVVKVAKVAHKHGQNGNIEKVPTNHLEW